MTAARRRWWPVVPVVALVTMVATGCGDAGDGSSPDGGRATKTITISDFEFAPETLDVKVGDTIRVDNKDSAEHTVTATDKSFDTGRFASGTKTFTVTRAGRFEYLCDVHPFMTHRFIQVSG